MTRYQIRKGRLIAAALLTAACESDTPFANLPHLAARMNQDQWRAVSFAAGVPIADTPAKLAAIALLLVLV